mgnify:CR=1 FL=1
MKWPNKDEREKFEIDGFIEAYERLPEGRRLAIVSKGEKPDWIVTDTVTGEEIGVELTSVYLDDRSVPDSHMSWSEDEKIRHIPYNEDTMRKYKSRIISAIEEKIRKAIAGYDTTRQLILAIYPNEYVGIYLYEELEQLVKDNEVLFDNMTPFSEIAFWALGDGAIFRVRPS